MTLTPVPATVAQRKRAMRIGDGAIAALILAAALHFPAQGLSNLLWMLGSLAAALGIYELRKSIGYSDLPEAELDEYELKRHLEAREDGLRWSLGLSLAVFLLSGAVACTARFWVEPDGLSVTLFFAKVVYCQMIWVPFIVARSLAEKINSDELAPCD